MTKKPLFLDRDGVLNRNLSPYVTGPDVLDIFEWTGPALAKLAQAGFEFYVVSNQQGVTKGFVSQEGLNGITQGINEHLGQFGVEIRKFFYCMDLESSGSNMRKPGPGMFFAARDEFGLNLNGAFMIGDNKSDIEAGCAAGCRSLLTLTGVTQDASEVSAWATRPEQIFPTLLEAADWIIQQESR